VYHSHFISARGSSVVVTIDFESWYTLANSVSFTSSSEFNAETQFDCKVFSINYRTAVNTLATTYTTDSSGPNSATGLAKTSTSKSYLWISGGSISTRNAEIWFHTKNRLMFSMFSLLFEFVNVFCFTRLQGRCVSDHLLIAQTFLSLSCMLVILLSACVCEDSFLFDWCLFVFIGEIRDGEKSDSFFPFCSPWVVLTSFWNKSSINRLIRYVI
jgi:hypothetical protein